MIETVAIRKMKEEWVFPTKHLVLLDQMAKACHQTQWKPVLGFTLVPQCFRGSDVPNNRKHTIKRTSPASTVCGWTLTRP